MTDPITNKKKRVGEGLEQVVEDAQEIARELGLEPRDVKYWVVDNDEMNELAAYDGFQERYPHWRWGMKYDRQAKKDEHIGGRIFELVVNDTPCHAYLQMNNSMADQKAVITHVEGHADFFANNQWFQDKPNASSMLSRNADKIRSYMNDPDISREGVERWIDHALCLVDNIDQYSEFAHRALEESTEDEDEDVNLPDQLGVSDEVKEAVFREWGDEDDENTKLDQFHYLDDTDSDLLAFLAKNGKQYENGQAVELEEWQADVLDMIREEAYYYAPQKMTKIMNEGWASWTESLMMTDEEFADADDVITYSEHMALVMGSPGFNPYRLGKAMWEHIENTVNRREVVDKLLRIDGVNPRNFHSEIDFQAVHDELDQRDSYIPERRHYSLTRPKNQGFIQDINRSDLEKMTRYILEDDRYDDIEQAIEDVDYKAGWKRMFEIRETHNDVMFIDEFLTQQFVDEEEYFTYEYRASHNQMQVASRDVDDVRKKLLLEYTNFGKPTIEVATDNYNNSGELLLIHRYNGVSIDFDKAAKTLERIHEMWGRPVNLATIGKHISDEVAHDAFQNGEEPEPDEIPVRVRYDGNEFIEEELEEEIEEEIRATEVDYSTKPEGW